MSFLPGPDDTFCAPATGPVNASIAIIRVNGPGALKAVGGIFPRHHRVEPRKACHGPIVDKGVPFDDVIVLYFQAPASYTGDDLVEIYCHGNQFIVHRIVRLLLDGGVRLASPGEFTRRAFINGKMDLTEAEAVNHIITARSEWEVETSLKQMHGSLRSALGEIREELIALKADIETGIDFIEEDIEFVSTEGALDAMKKIQGALRSVLGRCSMGLTLSKGIDVAIAGKPNAGKSSILNLMLNQERAIVSDIPGTTRDMIRESVQIRGIHLNLVDTAGIGNAADDIERRGMLLSEKKIGDAALVLCVLDAQRGVTDDDRVILEKTRPDKTIYLANKIDLGRDNLAAMEARLACAVIPFSAKTGEGLELLESAIEGYLSNTFIDYHNSFIADARIINLLENALGASRQVVAVIEGRESPDIVAFELQALLDALGEITGDISPDDVLDSIFSRFCIGK
jgi:tRNA modification GTPase